MDFDKGYDQVHERVPQWYLHQNTLLIRISLCDEGVSMARMTGGEFIAETVQGYGITHVFFMPVIAPRALMEMERRGIP